MKRFEQTSSTRLELQTLLWALNEAYETMALTDARNIALIVYTDSQNIIGLPGRRACLEQNNFFSGKNKQLTNYELYQEFYRLHARLNCRFVKVAGHQASHQKDEIGKLFSLVDRASRRALRENR
jgi:ribonuclease HI